MQHVLSTLFPEKTNVTYHPSNMSTPKAGVFQSVMWSHSFQTDGQMDADDNPSNGYVSTSEGAIIWLPHRAINSCLHVGIAKATTFAIYPDHLGTNHQIMLLSSQMILPFLDSLTIVTTPDVSDSVTGLRMLTGVLKVKCTTRTAFKDQEKQWEFNGLLSACMTDDTRNVLQTVDQNNEVRAIDENYFQYFSTTRKDIVWPGVPVDRGICFVLGANVQRQTTEIPVMERSRFNGVTKKYSLPDGTFYNRTMMQSNDFIGLLFVLANVTQTCYMGSCWVDVSGCNTVSGFTLDLPSSKKVTMPIPSWHFGNINLYGHLDITVSILHDMSSLDLDDNKFKWMKYAGNAVKYNVFYNFVFGGVRKVEDPPGDVYHETSFHTETFQKTITATANNITVPTVYSSVAWKNMSPFVVDFSLFNADDYIRDYGILLGVYVMIEAEATIISGLAEFVPNNCHLPPLKDITIAARCPTLFCEGELGPAYICRFRGVPANISLNVSCAATTEMHFNAVNALSKDSKNMQTYIRPSSNDEIDDLQHVYFSDKSPIKHVWILSDYDKLSKRWPYSGRHYEDWTKTTGGVKRIKEAPRTYVD